MTRFKLTRPEVYSLIDGERAYQDERWSPETTSTSGDHSILEWFVFIEDYVDEAKHLMSRFASPDCDVEASRIMRKVAALAVAALENNGAPSRNQGTGF